VERVEERESITLSIKSTRAGDWLRVFADAFSAFHLPVLPNVVSVILTHGTRAVPLY